VSTPETNPPRTLPPKARRMWSHAYDGAVARGYSRERAAKQAWGAVRKRYHKVGNRWRVRPEPNPRGRLPKTEGTPLRRGPVDLSGAELASLCGYLERVELADGRVLRWEDGRAVAYWHPESCSLVAFHGIGRPRLRVERVGGRAADAFERWTGRPQKRAGTLRVDVEDHWVRFGPAVSLNYYSTKWPRRGPRYEHATTTRPTVYRLGGVRPPWVWVVRGGGFTLTRNGLVG